jgi:hypothetical protein
MKAFRAKSVYIQGNDVKAQLWTESFNVPVRAFTTLHDMVEMLCTSKAMDVLIFRYQNNPPKLLAAIAVSIVLTLLLIKASLFRMKVVWICHNVDQDTQPHFKWIERYRRTILVQRSDLVFVLDPLFVIHCESANAIPITFGPKYGGSTAPETTSLIRRLSAQVDRVVLIAGEDGGKYKAFERIPEIHRHFSCLGLRVGFVTAGMAPERLFPRTIEKDLLRINEPNLRESDLTGIVDYIYRENADISMPYTVYAAATAGIPVVTQDGSLLAKILLREKIGLTLGMLAINRPLTFDFGNFLSRHKWTSLREALIDKGIDV